MKTLLVILVGLALPAGAGQSIFLKSQSRWTNDVALVEALSPKLKSSSAVEKAEAKELLIEAARSGSYQSALALVTSATEDEIPKESGDWFRAEANKGNPTAQYQVGISLYRQRRFAEALPWFKAATSKKDFQSQLMLGRTYKELNRTAEAKETLVQAEAYRELIFIYCDTAREKQKWITVGELRGKDLTDCKRDFSKSATAVELKQGEAEGRAYFEKRWSSKK